MKGEEGKTILNLITIMSCSLSIIFFILLLEPMVTMMEVSSNVGIPTSDGRRLTVNGGSDMEAEISLTVIPQSDDDDDCGISSECSTQSHDNYSGTSADLMAAAMGDDITAQLAAAGWQKPHLHGLCSLFCFLFHLSHFPRTSPELCVSTLVAMEM